MQQQRTSNIHRHVHFCVRQRNAEPFLRGYLTSLIHSPWSASASCRSQERRMWHRRPALSGFPSPARPIPARPPSCSPRN